MFSEMGVNVVETEQPEEEEAESGELVEVQQKVPVKSEAKEGAKEAEAPKPVKNTQKLP
jgi:hypothetical protein